MAVNLVSTPDELSLTKGGRMVYQFSGSGRFQTTGASAASLLFVIGPVTEGTVITLKWNGRAHTLLFTAAPSAPNEFLTGDGSEAYIAALLTELAGFFAIREDFVLTRNEPNTLAFIRFTARKTGKAYDIVATLPANDCFGFGQNVAGADPILRTQYSVYAELWLQKVGTPGDDLDADYERIFSTPIETDADGNAPVRCG